MEIIDRSKVSFQERATREVNAVMESLVESKKPTKKYHPDEKIKAYLNALRKSTNYQGISKEGGMAILATFPFEVNVEMINKYGPGWEKNEGVLVDFMRNNPQYVIGRPDCKFNTSTERMNQQINAQI